MSWSWSWLKVARAVDTQQSDDRRCRLSCLIHLIEQRKYFNFSTESRTTVRSSHAISECSTMRLAMKNCKPNYFHNTFFISHERNIFHIEIQFVRNNWTTWERNGKSSRWNCPHSKHSERGLDGSVMINELLPLPRTLFSTRLHIRKSLFISECRQFKTIQYMRQSYFISIFQFPLRLSGERERERGGLFAEEQQ